MAICPACEAEIEVDEFDVDKGDQLSCPECGETLEVINVSPVELDLVSDEDEDEDEASDDEADEGSDEDDDESDDWDE
jgi:alpha-aminoadipate carrier protein LysW